ncbi:MAG: flavin reductase family protein [Actinomycetota bacterium]|nr:flavin reductase family protein [Actinomycetota bacterium]
MSIGGSDPFADSPESRSPVRRFRGRLASGVTLWTAGSLEEPAGLTVSSVMVAEPSTIFGLMNDLTGLWDAIHSSGAFVVHILERKDRILADTFAGLRPSPGGTFAGLDVEESDWGPVLVDKPTRAFCRYSKASPAGYGQLVWGEIERIETAELDEPLVNFRGRYRPLAP